MSETEDDTSLRLDVWLWRARFFKTRGLATTQIKRKGVRITRGGDTRRTTKPGVTLSPGDIVTFRKGKHIQTVEMLDAGTRRGPADEAQALYRVVEEDE